MLSQENSGQTKQQLMADRYATSQIMRLGEYLICSVMRVVRE